MPIGQKRRPRISNHLSCGAQPAAYRVTNIPTTLASRATGASRKSDDDPANRAFARVHRAPRGIHAFDAFARVHDAARDATRVRPDIVAPHARGRRFDIVAQGRRHLLARRRPRRLGFAPKRGPTRRLDARAHLRRRQVRLTFRSIPPRPARRGRNPNPENEKARLTFAPPNRPTRAQVVRSAVASQFHRRSIRGRATRRHARRVRQRARLHPPHRRVLRQVVQQLPAALPQAVPTRGAGVRRPFRQGGV